MPKQEKIIGVVNESDVGGVQAEGQSDYTIVLFLCPWRTEGGPIQTSTLRVEQSATRSQMTATMRRIKPLNTVALGGVQKKKKVLGKPCVATTEIVKAPPQKDLQAASAALRKPVNFKDSVFGTLTFDRSLNWYTGSAKWMGRRVRVYIHAEDEAALTVALADAHKVWKSQEKWDALCRDRAVKDMLPIKLDDWLEEGEKPVTAAQFLRRIKPASCAFHTDGDWDLSFNDGELFFGHDITVRANRTGVREVCLDG
jgi:hypothetical protein